MKRRQIRIRGIVQGVGFRPFVHNLARRLNLAGYVLNSSAGVVTEVEGSEAALDRFVESVRGEAPPLARIEEMLVSEIAPLGERDFVIRESQALEGEFVLVSPDVATCPDCYRDFTDPANRRYGYAFTNCTNCGPRYTIIRDIPYDRPNTTMAGFQMCAACQAEYDDPANRRFHAQPNACPKCGPQLFVGQALPPANPQPSVGQALPLLVGQALPPANPQPIPATPQPSVVRQALSRGVGQALPPANPRSIPADPRLIASEPQPIPANPQPSEVGQALPPANPRSIPSEPQPLSSEPRPSRSALIAEAQRLLHEGRIIALRGLGGFHLACDPSNDAAVRLLRERKRRSDKPFALMARDLAAVEAFCTVSDDDRRALESPSRPIVILPRRSDGRISPAVAPGNNTLGVMLPYTPLHHLLFTGAPYDVLVMTSGNLSEEPIVTSNAEALDRLRPLADWFLLHDRDIYMRADDSVVRVFEKRERVLRRSRGYVPQAIDLGMEVEEILACGAELKNTFCLSKGRYAVLSQHIGDMENYETLVFFEETLANLKKLFRVAPRAVAHDLHPLYLSTQYALGLPDLEKIGVQHHHAHVASCMAENGLRGKVIGVAFDGTGYGTDGQIWGGEILVADYAGFERRAHLRYVPLAGGDAAIRQPWRPALAYLADTFGPAAEFTDLAAWREVPESQRRLVRSMIAHRVNTVDTSSCGRLFDAVASLIGLRQQINFEGQAAIELEMIAAEGIAECYPFELDARTVDFRPAIERIVADVRAVTPAPVIAARFHNTVAEAIVEVCRRLRVEEKLNRVCLSGGTFQNMKLLDRTLAGLRRLEFEVFLHAQVPPNDGGIALGQAVIATEVLRRRG
ncbi:MAG: carbamoyltransferase HypF [Bryobacteraceae bacterium]